MLWAVKDSRGIEREEGRTKGPHLQHTGSHEVEIKIGKEWIPLSILREAG